MLGIDSLYQGQNNEPRKKNMKHVLLATTALTMTASVAAADISFSGRTGAGVASTATAGTNGVGTAATETGAKSVVWSGVDLNVAASTTTDYGVTISMSDDFGGGNLPDYADKELDEQTSDLDQPAISVAYGGWSATFDEQQVDDLYDNTQNGDIGISGSVGALSIGITYDTDAKVHGGTGANAAIKNANTSYSLGYSIPAPGSGSIALKVLGTDANDSGDAAMEWSGSYAFSNGMTLTIEADNKGKAEDVTTAKVAYTLGALNLSLSADDNDDWDGSVSYSAGGFTASYATDEESAWEADVTMALGGNASLKASSDSTEFSVLGLEFTF